MREHRDRFQSLFDHMAEGVALHDLIVKDGQPVDYIVRRVNSQFEAITGLSPDTVCNNPASVAYKAPEPPYLDIFAQVALSGEAQQLETYFPPFKKHFSVSVAPWGKQGFATILSDITARKEAEEALRESETSLAYAQAIAHIGSWSLNLCDNSLCWSEETYRIRGFPVSEPPSPEVLIATLHPEDRDRVIATWETAMANATAFESEHRIFVGEQTRWIHEHAEFRLDQQGQPLSVVGTIQDITHTKNYQKQLEWLAHYDPLTQLPNRVLFADRMQMAIAQAKRNNRMLAVCYLDLDGFKGINDHLGHDAGDHLLKTVSRRLQSNMREGDTVARLGGDEFALLLTGFDDTDECEQTLVRLLEILAAPYEQLLDEKSPISASIGVTLYPQDHSHPDELLRHADQAMYAAKQAGRNRYHCFDPCHDHHILRPTRGN